MKRVMLLTAAMAFLAGCGAQKPAEKAPATAAAPAVLKVATDTTFPPMEFIDENQKISGFDVDLIKAVAEAAGYTADIKSVGWDGIFSGLTTDRYDLVVSSVTITDERKVTMDFSDPYINAGQVIVAPTASTLTDFKSLSGKKVAVQVKTTGDIEVSKDPSIVKKAYEDATLCFEDLINNRVEAVVIDTPVAGLYVKNPKFAGKIKVIGYPLTSEFYGFVVKKGNSALLEKINKGLASVKASGKLAEIETKWLK